MKMENLCLAIVALALLATAALAQKAAPTRMVLLYAGTHGPIWFSQKIRIFAQEPVRFPLHTGWRFATTPSSCCWRRAASCREQRGIFDQSVFTSKPLPLRPVSFSA